MKRNIQLLAILVLATMVTAQQNGCTKGKCSSCSLNRKNTGTCQQCYNSFARAVDGSTDMIGCEGTTLPVKNCKFGIEKISEGSKSFFCEGCDFGMMPSDDFKSCVKTSIPKCLETINVTL